MNSSPYSPPPIPPRATIADMILFYARPSLRDRIMSLWPDDIDLLDSLLTNVIGLTATWSPTTDWHWINIVQQDRTLEWMVWQVAMDADEDQIGQMYQTDAIIPWAIDMETLPRYDQLPTMLIPADTAD